MPDLPSAQRHQPSDETVAVAARMGSPALALEVVEVTDVAPALRRVGFVDPALAEVEHHAGQDLTLSLDGGAGRAVRRRYTIRRLDRAAARVDVDIVLHGNGPGARWAAAVRPGERLDAVGPRGKIFVDDDAEWHLFAGDESYLPAAFAMAESLPAGRSATVLIEHGDDFEPLRLAIAAELTGPHWVLRRGGGDAGASLAEAVAGVDLPSGAGHAYVGGEARTVSAVRDALRRRGLADEAISAKPYWRADRANADHGEPTRD